jgi:hypothetical protein
MCDFSHDISVYQPVTAREEGSALPGSFLEADLA